MQVDAAGTTARMTHPPADVRLEPAVPADLPVVAALMNHAYRDPEGSWTNEADYLSGERTSVAMLRAEIAASPEGRLLLWRGPAEEGGGLLGCVWLVPEAGARWYLGGLTVEPGAQNAGLGRRLLTAAEAWIAGQGGRAVRMTVVNVRESLIAWYLRRGYAPTGETEAFPYGDDRFGVPQRDDLAFIVLQKPL
ncbi:GNAT superfamily N-acetyltransferase [Amaricoccus macauensis]|uniref:GNAT superfamily N-acetyltransferase n=1 Tax=Amaricoccus macauensis TaxID=57001 RepID=A0A840SZF0_9RHOB|nr:GNAT family N-acetyltransferase [Amaricoccus macauensis]MBB5224432.1 GNAT superfamily N-acetyltransferase [Amaricoccus macauensis]